MAGDMTREVVRGLRGVPAAGARNRLVRLQGRHHALRCRCDDQHCHPFRRDGMRQARCAERCSLAHIHARGAGHILGPYLSRVPGGTHPALGLPGVSRALPDKPETPIMLGTILLILLVLMLLGAIPVWPHSRGWGYVPSGGIGLVAVVIVVLILLGRL